MNKYVPFGQIPLKKRSWPDNVISKAPVWCSVDLRDGNQALPVPMTVEQKLEYFDLLVKIGFKEIEIGFPASNNTEFNFVRRLIDEKRIPPDVSVQVLSQAREHLVRRTMQAIAGAPKVIFHLYNAISPVQREFTFGMSEDELVELAVEGVKNVKKYSKLAGLDTQIRLEYSPEDFSGADGNYAVRICSEVLKEWNPSADNPIIFNLPATVEHATPNIFADQVEFFIDRMNELTGSKEKKDAEGKICNGRVIVSIHNHNDRGTGIAACELGLLAGATRIEGTLFGNGERTGNLDMVAVALNMFTQGIETGLDFSQINSIAAEYTRLTGMQIPPRQPYCGSLVFTAFSGSHQDAIRKALAERVRHPDSAWNIPYLPIDPKDVGREYEEIIRINAQSGKGGTAWILETDYGIILPKGMLLYVGLAVKEKADGLQRELSSAEVYDVFKKGWLENSGSIKLLDLAETHVDGSAAADNVLCRASVSINGKIFSIGAKGNGPLDAFAQALKQTPLPAYSVTAFHEHSVGSGNDTDAMAYVELNFENGIKQWGAGRSSNIGRAGINAVVSALNRFFD